MQTAECEETCLYFVTKGRLKNSRNDDETRKAAEVVAHDYKPQVLKLLNFMVPAAAKAFRKQKGDIFQFEEYDEGSSYAL